MGVLLAFRFLTPLPLGARAAAPAEIGAAQVYFPLVGLVLGLLIAGLDFLLRAFLPAPLVAALLLLAWTLLSGGLHLDGLMDTCDGVFNHSHPARRLEIMQDARVGAYGATALGLDLLLKFTAVLTLPATGRTLGLLLATAFAYWAMTVAIFAFPPARPLGLGAVFKAAATPGRLLLATVLALAPAAALAGAAGLLLALPVLAATLAGGRYICGRLGGLTGDTYGALHEIAMLVALVVWPILARV